MPTVRHKVSFAVAEVGDEAVEGLVASGQWELASTPVRKPRTRKAVPVEEPVSEE